jgi:hypothetical protein
LLTTTITYEENVHSQIMTSPFIRKINATHYEIHLSSTDKVIGNINVSQNVITIQYSSELLLEEFIIIHDVISHLKKDSIIDDSKSFLGYLPNGESAYIIRNWKPWLDYIQQSMKYCQ